MPGPPARRACERTESMGDLTQRAGHRAPPPAVRRAAHSDEYIRRRKGETTALGTLQAPSNAGGRREHRLEQVHRDTWRLGAKHRRGSRRNPPKDEWRSPSSETKRRRRQSRGGPKRLLLRFAPRWSQQEKRAGAEPSKNCPAKEILPRFFRLPPHQLPRDPATRCREPGKGTDGQS